MGTDWMFEATDVKSRRLQRIDQRWPHTEPATIPLHNDGSEWKAPFDSPLDCDERLYRCPDGSLVLVWKVDESNSHYHCDYVYRCEPMSESEGRAWCERQGFGLPDQLRAAQRDLAPMFNYRSYRSLWDFGRKVENALERVLCAGCNLCCDELGLERDVDAPAIRPAVAKLDALIRVINDVDDWINTPNGADELVDTLFTIQRETRSLVIKVGHSQKPLTWNGDFKKLTTLQGFLTRRISDLASIPELECELHAEALQELQRASSDEPPQPGDVVVTPDRMDVGIVEPLPNYPDEMLSPDPPATEAQATEAAKQKVDHAEQLETALSSMVNELSVCNDELEQALAEPATNRAELAAKARAVEALAGTAAVESALANVAPVEKGGKRLWTVGAAEPIVKAHLKKYRYATAKEIERETGIPDSTVCKTQSWKRRPHKRRSGKKHGRHQAVSLTDKVMAMAEKVVGPDVDVEALIRRCEAEPEFRRTLEDAYDASTADEAKQERGRRPVA